MQGGPGLDAEAVFKFTRFRVARVEGFGAIQQSPGLPRMVQRSFEIGEQQQGGGIARIVINDLRRQIVRVHQVAAIVGNAHVALEGFRIRGVFADEVIESPQSFRLMSFEEVQVSKLQLCVAIAGMGGEERGQGLSRLGVVVQVHFHAGQAHGVFGVRRIMRRKVLEDGQGRCRAACPHLHARQSLEGIGITRALLQEPLEVPEGGVVLAVKGQSAPQANLGVVVIRGEFQNAAIGCNRIRVVAAPDL